ncbi:hypothetical protein [Rhodanobacter sp. C05]|uniref:hypothetical protein n=1 Tax=Rhodanobacter sp. C05 TaxID=1945855 RepID=UPI0009D371C7|nr:hypothetical protein [Rhodanobacter sp. C05]OOG41944.1 hypothetical protein B0E51_05095 [Rhodanobacter sp. C05]
MRAYLLPMMILIATSVTGCDRSDHYDTITNYISIHDGSIAVHAPGRADADITAAGDLNISGTSVTVTTAQRDLLKHYYSTALTLRNHGIATGNAGIATAGKALSSVASGLASGNTDKIDSDVNASAAKVEAQAALICNDLADLRSTQETLADQLPAFQPYALIKANEVEDCRGRKISRE